MAIFIDSSNIKEIEEIMRWGIISGATTNPKILSQDGARGDLKSIILQIIKLVKGPVSVEVTEESFEGMLAQAKQLASWDKEHVVIKVPIGQEGLRVATTLENQMGIKTNVTCVMSFNQAYLAALAGATYVSIFYGRIKDMGYEPQQVIADTREMIDQEELKTQIITGSIRHMMDVNEAFLAGSHIVTVTPSLLKTMVWNPQSEKTIAEFKKIWGEMTGRGDIT